MEEISVVKRHRWSALWNGVVIGLGASGLLFAQPIAIIPLVMGIGLELMQRNRLNRQQ